MKSSVTTTSDPDSEALAALFSSDAEDAEIGPGDEDEEDEEKPAAKPADPDRLLAELRSGLDQLEALLSR
jgi:hypothetical protein